MKQISIIIGALLAVLGIAFAWFARLWRPQRLEAMPTSTSAIASAIAVEGMVLQMGGGGSPQTYNSICNVQDWNEPDTSEVVDVTNVGDKWRRRIPTLLDLGKMKFKIFWVMREPTHQNGVTGAISGLRYIWINQILTNFQVVYPDAVQSADQFAAYVTSFSITGKVGGVFEAEIELTANTGGPVLV